MVPEPDEMIFTPDLWVPLVRVQNVLIFPGVPRLFHMMVDNWFVNHATTGSIPIKLRPQQRVLVKTLMKESVLSDKLREIQESVASQSIQIGSYPKLLDDGQTYVVLSIVGPSESADTINTVKEQLLREFNGQLVHL